LEFHATFHQRATSTPPRPATFVSRPKRRASSGACFILPNKSCRAEGSLLRPPLGPRAQMGGAHHDQFELYRKSFEVEPVRNDSLVAIGERLDAKGVSLKVLEQAIDTSTPTGRLMFNMLGAIAQFEGG
jgi:hypothetical protein